MFEPGIAQRRPDFGRDTLWTLLSLRGFSPALLMLGAALLCSPNNAWRLTQNVAVSDLLFALSMVLVLAEHAFLRKPLLLPTKVAISFMLVAGCGLLPPLLQPDGPDFSADLLNLAKILVSAFMIPLVFFWQRIHSSRELGFLALAYTAGVLIGVVAAIARKQGIGLPGPFAATVNYFGRAQGLTLHANMVGLFSALAVPYLIYFAMTLREKWLRLAFAAAIVPIALVVNWSGSRAALVALLFGLALMFWRITSHLPRRTYMVALFAMLAMLGGLVYLAAPDGGRYEKGTAVSRLLRGEAESSVQTSDAVRAGRLEVAQEQILSSPVYGNGYAHILDSHSIYVQLLAAGGVLTIFGFLYYAWYVFELYWRARTTGAASWQMHLLMYAALVAVATWLLNGIRQNFLIERSPYIAVGLLLATARYVLNLRPLPAPPAAGRAGPPDGQQPVPRGAEHGA